MPDNDQGIGWLWGDTEAVMASPHPDATIRKGDLVWLTRDCRHIRPVSEHQGSALCSVQWVISRFLGVALQANRWGRDAQGALLRVATAGVFGFSALPGDYLLGDLLVPALRASEVPDDPRLCNQQVQLALTNDPGIAQVVFPTTNACHVRAAVRSAIMR